MNILILGSGGREHALAWKLSQSPECEKLFIAPGNAGTASCGKNISLSVLDFEGVKKCVLENKINLVLVGPEDPLVKGIADFFLEDNELKSVFLIGPGKNGAQLEGSKDFAKAFMQRNGIPTAASRTFSKDELASAYKFLETMKAPYVLKADGLAAGKGVVILSSIEEAREELDEMLVHKKFGAASSKVVIEEFLNGIELSVFVLTDGHSYKILPEAKDYKRIGEQDTGLNTGGMGAVSPVPFADKTFMQKVEQRIVVPTINGLKKENIPYKGFVFIGLINVDGDPFVIEYNVRMGDPETEVVIPRIQSDLVDLLKGVGTGTLASKELKVDPRTAVTVMLVSGGYPGDYKKGKEIRGIENVKDSIAFHAGTEKDDNGKSVTAGGRVIAVTSFGDAISDAGKKTYSSIEKISFDEMYYRKDIGKDLI